jgi:hypothetical protein
MAKGVKWATDEQRLAGRRAAGRKFWQKIRQDPLLREKQNLYQKELRQRKREENPEAHAIALAKRREKEKHSAQYKKTRLIRDWRRRGVIDRDDDGYNIMYDYYLQCTHCECCNTTFGKYGDGSGTHKCLDHCHKTGEMRSVVCQRCNIRLG